VFSRRTAWADSDEAPLLAEPGTIDLTMTNPTAVGLVHPPDLYASLGDPGSAAYHPDSLGLPSAREAVAAYYAARGAVVPTGDICLLASTSEGYSHLLSILCDPGDVVLVPQPGYPLLPMIADLAGVELRSYPLLYHGTWSIDLDALAAAARVPGVRAIVLVAPNNPTGSYLSADELAFIDALAAELGIAVLADEVFFDYPLRPVPAVSPIVNTGALTFVLSGLSKVAALPQLKLAWVAARGPDVRVREALRRLELVADTFLSPATPVQRAAAALLAAAPAIQARILARARQDLAALAAACAGSTLTPLTVEGGWTALVRLPRVFDLDGRGWARELLRAGVLTQPGELYDLPDHLALSLLTPEPQFHEGLGRLTEHVARVVACGPCSR
jgi:alanine-synthesizing transaminase